MEVYKRRKSNQHVYNQWLGEPGSKRNPANGSLKLWKIIQEGRFYSETFQRIFKKTTIQEVKNATDITFTQKVLKHDAKLSGILLHDEAGMTMTMNASQKEWSLNKNIKKHE